MDKTTLALDVSWVGRGSWSSQKSPYKAKKEYVEPAHESFGEFAFWNLEITDKIRVDGDE